MVNPDDIVKMGEAIFSLSKQAVTFSVLNSLVVFGIVSTIKKVMDKEEIHRFVGICVTYGIGIIMGFLIGGIDVVWQKFLYGMFIGSCTVAVYKSATQSILGIIPKLVDKFLG